VFGGGPPLSLFDDLDLLVFICRHAGDCRTMCTSDAGHPQKNAPIDAAVLYTNRWLDRAEQQAAPGRLNEADTVLSGRVVLFMSCIHVHLFFFARLFFYTCNFFFCYL
jgi:hypothetical protein